MAELTRCPDLEQLAALLDGRLTDAERSQLLSHIDSCESCFEVFGEAARFVAESEQQAAVWPSGRYRMLAALAAAALLMLIGIPVLTLFLPTAQPRLPALSSLIEPLTAEVTPASLANEVETARFEGRGFTALSPAPRAFRVGVLLVDLHIAAAAKDSVRSLALLRLGASLVANAENGAAAAQEWRRSEVRLLAEAPHPEGELGLVSETDLLEAKSSQILDRFFLDLGKWAEVGRMAAASSQGAVVRDSGYRQFLDRALDNEAAETWAGEQLRGIQRALEGEGIPSAADFEALLDRF